MKINLKNKSVVINHNNGIKTHIKNGDFELDLTSSEIEEIIKKKEVKLRPEVGDKCYKIMNDSNVIETTWDDSIPDNCKWNSGNMYFTEEDALNEVSKRQALVRIKDYVKKEGLENKVYLITFPKHCNGYHDKWKKMKKDCNDDLEILENLI